MWFLNDKALQKHTTPYKDVQSTEQCLLKISLWTKYAHKYITIELYIWIKHYWNQKWKPTHYQYTYSSNEKQPPAELSTAPDWRSSALQVANHTLQTFICHINSLVLSINRIESNPTVGSRKWSHKTHPDHRQYVAYTRIFSQKMILPNNQNVFLYCSTSRKFTALRF